MKNKESLPSHIDVLGMRQRLATAITNLQRVINEEPLTPKSKAALKIAFDQIQDIEKGIRDPIMDSVVEGYIYPGSKVKVWETGSVSTRDNEGKPIPAELQQPKSHLHIVLEQESFEMEQFQFEILRVPKGDRPANTPFVRNAYFLPDNTIITFSSDGHLMPELQGEYSEELHRKILAFSGPNTKWEGEWPELKNTEPFIVPPPPGSPNERAIMEMDLGFLLAPPADIEDFLTEEITRNKARYKDTPIDLYGEGKQYAFERVQDYLKYVLKAKPHGHAFPPSGEPLFAKPLYRYRYGVPSGKDVEAATTREFTALIKYGTLETRIWAEHTTENGAFKGLCNFVLKRLEECSEKYKEADSGFVFGKSGIDYIAQDILGINGISAVEIIDTSEDWSPAAQPTTKMWATIKRTGVVLYKNWP